MTKGCGNCGQLLNLTANAMFESTIFYWAGKGKVLELKKEEYMETLTCTECGVDLCNDANPLNGQSLVADVFGTGELLIHVILFDFLFKNLVCMAMAIALSILILLRRR